MDPTSPGVTLRGLPSNENLLNNTIKMDVIKEENDESPSPSKSRLIIKTSPKFEKESSGVNTPKGTPRGTKRSNKSLTKFASSPFRKAQSSSPKK
jgi:hypothetical protein